MLIGVVLAGGQSRRMGTNKLYLESAGKTLLGRAIELLESAGCEQMLVSGEVKLPEGSKAILVPDLDFPYAGGPPRGLFSALEWIRQQHELEGQQILLIPADMPRLHTGVLESLINKAENFDAVIYSGEVFPLLVCATDKVYGFIRTGLENERPADQENAAPRFSMKTILAGLDTRHIDKGADDEVFSNLNTPDDWDKYSKLSN